MLKFSPCGLTPELSRTAAGEWDTRETAKRSRLERDVSWVSGCGTWHAALPQFT